MKKNAPGLSRLFWAARHPTQHPASNEVAAQKNEAFRKNGAMNDNRELYQEKEICAMRKQKVQKKTNKHNEQVSSIYCREWWTKSTKEQQTYSNIQLVGGIPNPLNNMSSSVGIMKFPTEWKVIKFHGSSHHQLE